HLVLPLAALVRNDLREMVYTMGTGDPGDGRAIARRAVRAPLRARPRSTSHARRVGGEPAEAGRPHRLMRRPPVVGADGREVPLSTWEELCTGDPLEDRAYEQMVVGVATRKYDGSLEPLPDDLAEGARATSRTNVSREFTPHRRSSTNA